MHWSALGGDWPDPADAGDIGGVGSDVALALGRRGGVEDPDGRAIGICSLEGDDGG